MKIAKILAASGTQLEKLLAFLDTQPADEVFTLNEIREKLELPLSMSGSMLAQHAQWAAYAIKMRIAGRLQYIWGSRKSIAKLRAQLATPEDTDGEN